MTEVDVVDEKRRAVLKLTEGRVDAMFALDDLIQAVRIDQARRDARILELMATKKPAAQSTPTFLVASDCISPEGRGWGLGELPDFLR